MSDDDGDRDSDSDYDDTAEQRRACPSRRPLVPPNTTSDESDDESKTKRRRHKQTTSPFQIVRVENRDVYCITDFGLKVARRAAAAKPLYGDVEGFIIDDKTGTLILGRCVFGDGTPWSILLRSWRRKNSHAAAFLKGYGTSALDALVMKSERDVVLLPVIDSESRHARGVLPEWCEAMVKENPRVTVDATILSHVDKIGKPSHDKPQLRAEFHAIFGPDVDVAALAKHKGKLLIITATHFFTHGKLDGYLKVLTAGAHGFDIVFQTMVVAACGSAISHIQPVALTKPVHDRLVAASELALQSDEDASTEVKTRLGHIYAAQEPVVSKDRYVGSTCGGDRVMKTYGSKLLVALKAGERRDVASYSKLLMEPRARTHQYQLARGDKGERFTRWFKSAVAAIKQYHFLRSMSEQCIVVSAKNDSDAGFRSALLRLEGHALYLAHEDARNGVMPTLNIATNAFFIGGEKVPDPERGGEAVWQGHTMKAQRRRAATRAVRGLSGGGQRVPTCLEVGAAALEAALAMAGDGATLAGAALGAVARALDTAAKNLARAPRRSDESEDAHMMYRAAECCWHAAVASAEAVGDAAVAHARALVDAAAAIDAAARRVAADVEPEVKLAARRDLEDAEAAWKRLYEPKKAPKPKKARRPRPTSRATRHRTTNASSRRRPRRPRRPRRRRRCASRRRRGARVPSYPRPTACRRVAGGASQNQGLGGRPPGLARVEGFEAAPCSRRHVRVRVARARGAAGAGRRHRESHLRVDRGRAWCVRVPG